MNNFLQYFLKVINLRSLHVDQQYPISLVRGHHILFTWFSILECWYLSMDHNSGLSSWLSLFITPKYFAILEFDRLQLPQWTIHL